MTGDDAQERALRREELLQKLRDLNLNQGPDQEQARKRSEWEERRRQAPPRLAELEERQNALGGRWFEIQQESMAIQQALYPERFTAEAFGASQEKSARAMARIPQDQVQRLKESGDNPLPRPELGELVRVIASGERIARPAGTLTLYSVEIYAGGFLLRAQIAGVTSPAAQGFFDFTEMDARPAAIDDAGGAFECWSLGSASDRLGHRFDLLYGPAPSPEAHMLTLELPALVWRRQDNALGQMVEIERQPGTWRFVQDLGSGKPHETRGN